MLNKIIPIVEEAGALALSHFRSLAPDDIASKHHLDLVTVADRAVESLLAQRLHALFADDGIFGEEGSRDMGRSGRVWVIDPIDGTFNFVRGRNDWAISVGLYEDGQPSLGVVLQPAQQRLLTGGRHSAPCLNGRPLAPLAPFRQEMAAVHFGNGGTAPKMDPTETFRQLCGPGQSMVRISNASTAAMIEVITGEVDGYVSCGDASWDLMGTWSIAKALGAATSLDWSGFDLDDRRAFVIGRPGFVSMCEALNLPF